MSFETLLSELKALGEEQETMQKALPADEGKDDDKIQAAAADGGDADADGAGAGDGAGDGDGDADKDADDGEPMGKALGTVTLESGEQVEAVDGTELVKSLMARVEASEGDTKQVIESLAGVVKGQSTLIKSLTEQVNKLASTGRGRKAAVSVHEKTSAATPLVKSEPSGMKPNEFMAKALTAQAEGKILGREVAMIEAYVNRGLPVPEHLVSKVVGQ